MASSSRVSRLNLNPGNGNRRTRPHRFIFADVKEVTPSKQKPPLVSLSKCSYFTTKNFALENLDDSTQNSTEEFKPNFFSVEFSEESPKLCDKAVVKNKELLLKNVLKELADLEAAILKLNTMQEPFKTCFHFLLAQIQRYSHRIPTFDLDEIKIFDTELKVYCKLVQDFITIADKISLQKASPVENMPTVLAKNIISLFEEYLTRISSDSQDEYWDMIEVCNLFIDAQDAAKKAFNQNEQEAVADDLYNRIAKFTDDFNAMQIPFLDCLFIQIKKVTLQGNTAILELTHCSRIKELSRLRF